MAIPVITDCCCCGSKTTTIVLGIFQILFSLYLHISNVYIVIKFKDVIEGYPKTENTLKAILITLAALYVIDIAKAVVVIVGAVCEYRSLLLPGMIVSGIVAVALLILGVCAFVLLPIKMLTVLLLAEITGYLVYELALIWAIYSYKVDLEKPPDEVRPSHVLCTMQCIVS